MVHGYAFGCCSYAEILCIVETILSLRGECEFSAYQLNDLAEYVFHTASQWEEYAYLDVQDKLSALVLVVDEYLDNCLTHIHELRHAR